MNPLLKFKLILISIATFCCSFIYAATAITDSTSTLTQPTAKKPNAAFVQENGYLPNSITGSSFNTQTKCPNSFSPYVTLSLGEITDQNSRTITSFKLCVTSLNTSGNHVVVNVSQAAKYFGYNAIHMQQPSGQDYYLSFEKIYDIRTSEPMPDMFYMNSPGNSPTTILKRISYTLYCYPQGSAPPVGCT